MGFYSMVAFFQKGGVFMYPILLVFAVGIAISFERWVQLNRIRNTNQKVWDQLHPVLVKGEFDKARKMANKNKSNMAQMLGMGLARQGAVRRRDDIEIAMEESMMEIIPPNWKSGRRMWRCFLISPLFWDCSAPSWG